ncbi:Uncharacterized protein TCM_032716 [Theobroma cacao]|uniref:RNase H type-1 domain-containing protein n=1 Tax=Theobroma cacao TaxID=3641 RepID=A0A061FA59_THECC|nr:Uncharacterized protein TCM_032716 [Theobroma cacao]
MVNQYRQANLVASGSQAQNCQITRRWCRPQGVKLNMDAALVNVNGIKLMVARFLLRNHAGEVMFAGFKRRAVNTKVVEVEMKAVHWSFLYCSSKNLRIDELELDCKVIVSWLRDNQVNGGVEHIVEDCKVMLEKACRW